MIMFQRTVIVMDEEGVPEGGERALVEKDDSHPLDLRKCDKRIHNGGDGDRRRAVEWEPVDAG
jgi:hypothetical protein